MTPRELDVLLAPIREAIGDLRRDVRDLRRLVIGLLLAVGVNTGALGMSSCGAVAVEAKDGDREVALAVSFWCDNGDGDCEDAGTPDDEDGAE